MNFTVPEKYPIDWSNPNLPSRKRQDSGQLGAAQFRICGYAAG
ncbi:hypothetical protein BIFDEN_02276 [Bifidobacterium dentium ATCC 27678]|nr:hypothetical protein BIFDEN_02276 [Bifidobacterium dentium ATCC 27678]